MKRLKLFSLFLLLLIGVGQVWGVTITGAAYKGKGGSSGSGGSATATVSGVTITSTKAYYSSDSEIREYQDGTLTVSSSSTITSIEITCTANNRANFSTTTGTLSAKGTSPQTWTGSATSVTFTADAQSRWSSIEVTLSGGTQEPTALSTPTGMSSGTPGMTSATLSWNAVANASGYALTIGNGAPITGDVFTISNSVVSYNLTGLDAETNYTWKVKAVGDGENYSDSEDCDTQNFITAEDPSQMTLTFGLTSDPGGWPTTNSTTTTNYTYTLNAVNYSFALNNVKCNSGYLMMTKTAILGLPAIENYKLVKVVASNTGGCSTSVNVAITSAATGDPVVSGGTGKTWSTQSSNYTYNLIGTDYNTMYYMYVTSANAQVTQLKLTYKPKPEVSSISIKTAPTKTTYTANETFDPSGLVITVNYADETSEDVTYNNTTASDFTFSPTTSTALNATNTSVTVTYGTKTANQAITVNRIATSLEWQKGGNAVSSYSANLDDTYAFPTLATTPANLSGVTFESSNTDVVETISSAGVPTVKATGTTTITAKFAQTNVYAAATDASYTLTINAANSPSLEAEPTALAFDPTAVSENRQLTFNLYGFYLTADASLEITGDDKDMFSVASSVAKDANDEIAEEVTVTYAPTAAGSHTATLTISSAGATSIEVALSGQAKVRRTVTWYKGDEEELTAQERGSATTSVLDGDAVTAIPSAPASCDEAISFMGWTDATYAKNDAAPANLYTDVEDFPAISGNNATYYAVWAEVKASNGSVAVTYNSTNFPTTYAAAQDCELEGYSFNILQIYKNGEKMQWRKSGHDDGTGTIYNNEAFPGHISSVVVVYDASDSNKNHTLKIGSSANPTSGTSITPSASGSTYTFDCSDYSYDYFVLTNGTGAGYTSSVTINYAYSATKDYTTTCAAPVEIADPTFSLEGGTYNDDQTLTISKTAPATTIYYTDDNSDPKNSATKKTYSSALTINQDVTIKAIATDGNGNWSEVVSKTYVINYSTSIAAFIEKAQASARALKLNAAQNCIITGIREYNSKYDVYMQDASNKGIIVYGLTTLPEGAAEGKRIEGAISGTYALANGQHRITGANFTNATFNAAEALTPAAITAVDADAYNANPIMLVKLSGVYYNTDSYYFTSEAEGEGTSNYVYDSFKKFEGKTMPANTVACDITGILINYNGSTPELLPLSLTTSATAVLPAISPAGGADAGNAVEVAYMSTVSVPMVENEEVYISVNDAEPALLAEAASVQIEGDVKLVVSAKRDFYADNTVTYYYKPSSYPKQIAVTSEHGDVVVKVGDNTVSTALPESNVTFTVAEAAHFHIASVAVNYEGGSLTPALSEGKYSFTMPDKDVTIALAYTEDTHYTITYAAGGATSGSAPAGALTWQYAGENVELLVNEYVWDEDHNFTGWKVTYGETEWDKAVGQSFEMPAANVTITAQWAEKQYCALTLKVNGADYLVKNIEQDVEQTISDLADYADPESQSGYEFVGWATSQEADDVTEAIATIESYTPQAGETSKTLYAVFSRVDVGTEKTDVLTAADMTATGTGYVEFSGVNKTSNAVYAGNSAKNDADAIQLRSKDSNSGIVSTTTGGVLQSVKINVASGSNTIDVYGSNTAYSAASDLYASATQGTKIGSTSSTTTINAAADYNYVGIRSNSGAIYLSSVEITWQPKTTYYTTAPSAVYAVSYALGGGAWQEDEGCDGANVKAGQTFDICESVPVREHFKFVKWQVAGEDVSGTITINAATAITAIWEAKVESNVTYNAGTGTGSDVVVSNVEEGTEVTLKTIGTGSGQANFTKTGYNFKGWLSNGVLYKAGETFEMPAEAITLTAQWKKQNVEKLSLVTDASQLLDGMEIVLACKNPVSNNQQRDPAIAGVMIDNKYLKSVTTNVTFNNDNTVSYTNEDVITLALEWDNENEGWALRNGTNYLTPNGNNNQVKWGNTPFIWSISFANGNAYIQQGSYTINYNASSGTERFSQYTNQQNDIQIYGKATVVNSNTNISDYGYVEGDVIVLSNNATLTVDADIAPTTMIVPKGSTVTVNDNQKIDANTLIVERGGTLDIQTNGTVKTDETFVIYSTLGKGNGGTSSGNAPGSSSQIKNANKINATGDVFFELELTQEPKASAGWYAFSVPFPVDAMTGVYYGNTQLQNEVGYAIMSYHGDKRAAGEYAWKKYRDIMAPGVLYIIAVGDEDYKTLRFKKHGDDAFSTSTGVAVKQYSSDIDGAYAGWNGIGNPSMQVSYLPETDYVYYMQFLDHANNRFQIRQRSKINLVVGSAFFIQYRAADGQIAINTGLQDGANGYLAPTRERSAVEESIYEISLFNTATNEVEDNVFITAREEATNSYEIGRDVAKMIMGTAKCAQMSIQAYGKQLGAADFPLVNGQAAYPLTITAPAAGTYTISTEAQDNADIYLTQDGAIIWNLSMGEYELNLTQGTMNDYGLLLIKKAPGIATGVDEISGEKAGVQKIVIEDKVFILRGGKMYDVTGKAVK